jgi:hypothetical protein
MKKIHELLSSLINSVDTCVISEMKTISSKKEMVVMLSDIVNLATKLHNYQSELLDCAEEVVNSRDERIVLEFIERTLIKKNIEAKVEPDT